MANPARDADASQNKSSKTMGVVLRLLLAGTLAWFFGLGILSAGNMYHLIHPACPPIQGKIPPGFQEAKVPSQGGYLLDSWWHPSTNQAVVILLGGNGMNRSSLQDDAQFLAARGYGVLSLDNRSCAGRIATFGYREVDDLAGAVEFVHSQDPAARTGVLGFSVGGITAIRGAARLASIQAVVAEGGFSSLVHEVTGSKSPPLSVTWTIQRWTLFFYTLMTGVFPGQVDPAGDIGRISPRPVLLIYGDQETGEGDAQIQYQAARDPRELWIVPGAGHGKYLEAQPVEYPARVTAFFDRWLLNK